MPHRSDLELNDTPAADIVAEGKGAFAGVDGRTLKVAQDFLRVAKRALGSFADTFAAHGLSPGRYAVLMALYRQSAGGESGLAPSEIAERLGVTRATMTGLITGLDRAGLTRSAAADPTDRRRKEVVLTNAGRALLEGVMPVIFRQMVAMVSVLAEPDQKALQTMLAKIEQAVPAAAPDDGKDESI